jgi:hypothetical protein
MGTYGKLSAAMATVTMAGRRRLFDWYVDSAGGNDLNDGKSPSTAFQTIAALTAAGISAGDRIGLARGSSWREQLTIAVNHVQVRAYGTGSKPLFDCADIISAGWSKTGGATNVYQVTLSTDYSAAEPCFTSVWEDGVRLPIVASAAACDAAPGSYYCANHNTTTPVIYVHATDSGDPASNGKVYEMPTRVSGVYGWAVINTYLEGVACKRNLSEGGSIKMGKYANIVNCEANEGNKHNMFIRGGTRVVNTSISEWYYGTGVANDGALVYYEASAAGEDVTITGCSIDNGGVAATGTGFNGHSGAGLFGTVTYKNCTV